MVPEVPEAAVEAGVKVYLINRPNWKCNFPMTHLFRPLLVGWLIGWLVGVFHSVIIS